MYEFMIIAGNEGGGSKAHIHPVLAFLLLVACGIALYLGGKRK